MLWRRSDSPLLAPSSAKPAPNKVRISSQSKAPFLHGEGDSFVGYMPVSSGVGLLLPNRGPAHVFRSVMAVIINAVKAVGGAWSRPHILVEAGEVHPSVADSDASISPSGLVLTSIVHGLPRIVFRGVRHAVGAVSCLAGHIANVLGGKASTGPAVSLSEVIGKRDGFAATFALAEPFDAAATPSDRHNGSKSTKPLTSNVERIVMKCYSFVSHVDTSYINVVRGLPVGAGSSRYSTTPLALGGAA